MSLQHAFIVLPRTRGRPRAIEQVSLVCWHCSKAKQIDLWPLEMVGDVVEHARRAGMVAKLDEENERVLIFCDHGCAEDNCDEYGYSKLGPPVKSRRGKIISSVYLLSDEE